VSVPGAAGPGARKAAGPVAQTRTLGRYPGPRPVTTSPHPTLRRPRSGGRRFFVALLAALLILAVPVVSAYVSYKLTSGENPFQWPPTMDLSKVF
jgi:hypothetical protein